jgi:NADH dehydrogenase
VNDDLTIPGHPEVQVIGDLANFSHQTGEPLPGVSPVAMQQGRHAARNILRMIRAKSRSHFGISIREAWLRSAGTRPLRI